MSKHRRRSILAFAAATLAGDFASAQQLAFPGADGAGRFSTGGRGGDVYYVTNLNDSGAGSLRNGISTATGPRTILFKLGGTIRLLSNLDVNKPNITIAGQTAPGGGITLADRMTRITNTSNVILRHVRLRVGDTYTRQVDSNYEPDSLWVPGSSNIMVDHVSASWSVDETLSVTHGSSNITVQWSNITESLRNAGHIKGNHGYGSLVNGGDITYHHNLYAHHDSRNPRPGSWEGGTLNFDFRNNVVYDWGGQAGYNGDEVGAVNMNYVGNYLVAGPATSSSKLTNAFSVGTTPTFIYQSGNKIDGTRDGVLNGTSGTDSGWSMFSNETAANKMTAPHPLAPVNTHTADDAYQWVLASGGATPWNRDAVDARIVGDVRSNGLTGSLIDSQDQVGGWPTLAAGVAPTDSDNDGMPNFWEIDRGLNPSAANHNVLGPNGYTNLENYLNYLTLFAGWAKDAGGNWSTISNWVGATPAATDATALFGPVITSPRTVTVDSAKTVGQISFNSAVSYTLGGSSAISMDVISGASAIDVLAGNHTITAPLAPLDDLRVTVTPSDKTLTLTNLQSSSNDLIKEGAGTLRVNRVRADGLSVNAGKLAITPSGASAGLTIVNTFSVHPSAALDLADNDLVVNNGSFTAIRSLVLTGFGATTGITSSTSDGSQILALFDNALVGASDWQGTTISANAIVGKYTYFGDANLDGHVTGDDYTVIDANLNTSPLAGVAWLSGDANLDGTVTGDDYTVIDANLGLGASTPLTPSAIPEPSTGLLVLLATFPPFGRRRRKYASDRNPMIECAHVRA